MESAGYQVETYGSAADYLDAYDPQKPGCLVLETGMPDMSGLEFQEKLVSMREHIPIIFVTASRFANATRKCRAMMLQ